MELNLAKLNLAKRRKEKGLTAKKMAELVGITQSGYTHIELGNRNPSVTVAKKIAKVLDFDWIDFFSD